MALQAYVWTGKQIKVKWP